MLVGGGVGALVGQDSAPYSPVLSRGMPAGPVHQTRSRLRLLAPARIRAVAVIRCWKLLAKLPCCPKPATALLAAILVRQLVEEQR